MSNNNNIQNLIRSTDNIVIVGDLDRRVVTSRLDPKTANPETRVFKSNPEAMILADRDPQILDYWPPFLDIGLLQGSELFRRLSRARKDLIPKVS